MSSSGQPVRAKPAGWVAPHGSVPYGGGVVHSTEFSSIMNTSDGNGNGSADGGGSAVWASEDAVLHWVSGEPPAAAACPVCLSIVVDPFSLIECGHTFCRDCLHSCVAAVAPDSTETPSAHIVSTPVLSSVSGTDRSGRESRSTGSVADSISMFSGGSLESNVSGSPVPWSSNGNGEMSVVINCPVCRCPGDVGRARPNVALRGLVSELPLYCRFRPLGCEKTVGYGSLLQHESTCEFAPRPCPHALPYGCEFEGSAAEVREHLRQCLFEKIRPFAEQQDARVRTLESRVEGLERENTKLRAVLARVSKSLLSGETAASDSKLSESFTRDLRSLSRAQSAEDLLAATASLVSESNGAADNAEMTLSGTRTVRRGSIDESHDKAAEGEFVREKWHVDSLERQLSVPGHARGVTCLLYIESVNVLVSSSFDHTIRLWDLTQLVNHGENVFACRAVLQGHETNVWDLATSSDSQRLYAGCVDGKIRCWDIGFLHEQPIENDNATHLDELPMTELDRVTGKIYAMQLWKDPQSTLELLFSAGADSFIWIFDVTDGGIKCVGKLSGHADDTVWSLALVQTSSWLPVAQPLLFSGGGSGSVKAWDIHARKEIGALKQSRKATALVAIPGMCFVSDQLDINVFSTESWDRIHVISQAHSWEIWCMRVDPEAGYLFSASFDHTIKVFDIGGASSSRRSRRPSPLGPRFGCVATLKGHKGYIHSIALGHQHVFSGSADRTVGIWSGSR